MDASFEPKPMAAESQLSRGLAKRLWMLTGLLAISGVLACLVVLSSRGAGIPVTVEAKPLREPVKVVGPGRLTIDKDSTLWQSLAVKEIERETIDTPLLQVTGFVLARVVAGKGNIADRWRFNTSELSGTYAEWLRSQSEVRFAESQLNKTRELAEAETRFLASVVKRLNPLVGNSSVPEAEILKAKADLSKAQLLGEKDIFSAESTLQSARNRQAALERELAQAGVDVAVFADAVEDMVLVVASVPEGRVSQVRTGQACRVRFYGYPDRQFPAHVESLSSLISQDRRTLRVLFELNDAKSLLKPGMFGDVDLGAEPRQALLVPDTAVLHLGRLHYLLVAEGDGAWRVSPVKIGDVHSGRVEIVSGVESPAKIVSVGGILLKPLAMQALALRAEGGP